MSGRRAGWRSGRSRGSDPSLAAGAGIRPAVLEQQATKGANSRTIAAARR